MSEVRVIAPCIALWALTNVGGSASADSAPPPGIKPVPVITVIEITESFPDYEFLETHVAVSADPNYRLNTTLRKAEASQPRPFSPLAEIELAPGRPARFQGGRGTQYEVCAVPRAALELFPDRAALFVALRDHQVPGAAWHLCQSTERIPAADPRHEVVLRYRVDRTETGDNVRFTPVGQDQAAVEEPMARSVVAGAAAAVAVVGLGLWWVGRKWVRKFA